MDRTDILLRFAINENDEEVELAENYIKLAELINELEIESREKTICIERLEESFMWAKKGLMI